MPNTRKSTAPGTPKEEEGAAAFPAVVPGESPEMTAIRLLQTSIALDQQRADARREEHEARMNVMMDRIADKLAAQQVASPPAPPALPPQSA